MVSKSKYMTRQRKMLLSCLGTHPDEMLSAQDIVRELGTDTLSLSAVYRNLADLEAEGKVRRSHKADTREVYFQYLGSETCQNCLHLSCTKCGRTFHMNTEEARQILDTVAKTDGFAIDKSETVLYGVCETCQK